MEKEKARFELEPIPVINSQDEMGYEGREQRGRKKYNVKTSSKPILGNVNVHVDKVIVEKIKDYAYWERLSMRKVMYKILSEFLSNKNVESRPKNVENRPI